MVTNFATNAVIFQWTVTNFFDQLISYPAHACTSVPPSGDGICLYTTKATGMLGRSLTEARMWGSVSAYFRSNGLVYPALVSGIR